MQSPAIVVRRACSGQRNARGRVPAVRARRSLRKPTWSAHLSVRLRPTSCANTLPTVCSGPTVPHCRHVHGLGTKDQERTKN